MKSAAYIRVSTIEQKEEGNSIENQKASIIQFAAIDQIYDIDFYIESVSGRDLSKRKEMLKLLENVSRGKYECVYVYSVTRLGRNMREGLEILHHIERNQAVLRSTKERLDTSSAMGKMFTQLMFSWAELESNQISERVKAQVDHNKAEGRRYSRPILGFSQDNEDKMLVVIPKEATVVQLIFKLREEKQKSMREIADICNRVGIKGKNGGKIRSGTVKKVLDRKELYVKQEVIK